MHRAFLLFAPFIAAATLLTGCPYGDVGAPCSHGKIEPLPTRRVTFPALSCDNLLCIYAEEREVPEQGCDDDSDCNPGGTAGNVCDSGTCKIGIEHVLKYSMCSKKCVTDDDCKNTGMTSKKRPAAKETACEGGFVCTRIQRLGEFCCEPMCVCQKYLGADDAKLNSDCVEGRETCDEPGQPGDDDDDDDDE